MPKAPSWSVVMWRTSNVFRAILVSRSSVLLFIFAHSSLAAARDRRRCQPDAGTTLSLRFGFNHLGVDHVPRHVPGNNVPGFGPCSSRPRDGDGLYLRFGHWPREVDVQQPVVEPR